MNRNFREDRNKTRPSIRSLTLEFASEEERIWFEGANGQGAFFYNQYPSFLNPVIVCSVGGRIYGITVQGTTGTVTKIFDGNAREYLHAWFCQGFQYLFIQDGINAPVIWDGTTVRRSDITKNEVPIGSVMAFIHGRLVVASADGLNKIFVGDIAYGDEKTSPANIINFTEQTYWAEGGNFDAPTFIGDIQGLYSMPFLDTGTGQNELVVMGTAGFTSLDLSTPRTQWIDNQVQRVALIGTGCVGSHAFAGLNGDVFYRAQDGIASYRNARVEYSQSWRQTPVSREVNYWIRPDRTDLLENIPMVTWQNMVITGCSPLISPPTNPCFGFHRYCRGMVVFDAQSMSTAGRQGEPVWHGAWTGIRPWAFAEGRIGNASRCFAFSYDRDGKNRLYEMTLQDGDDFFEEEPRSIFSFFTSRELGSVEARTSTFEPKLLTGGVIEMGDILGASTFQVQYRPDAAPCWVDVSNGTPGCDCPNPPTTEGCMNTSWPVWARKYFSQVPAHKCIPGTKQPAGVFHHCQVRVLMNGCMEVLRLNIQMDLQKDSRLSECLGMNCEPINCCPASFDYSYHIAPLGENTEVPVLTCEVVPEIYQSTRYATYRCPSTGQSVTAMGQATSTISQADADQKALADAQSNAQDALVCPTCNPSVLTQFLIDGGNVDLSEFFVSGLFQGNNGQPFRLIDVSTMSYIAYGTVNASGTLETSTTYPQYTHGSFDLDTNIYADAGGGQVQIDLQLGCAVNGQTQWPNSDPYNP
jgi:hypothetical protein